MALRAVVLFGCLAFALSACGGGGGPSSSVVPTNLPAAAPSALESIIALPAAGGYGGTMTFSVSVPTGSLAVMSSTTAESTSRIKQSGTLSVFFYVTMLAKSTLTLPGLPSFNLTLPATYTTAGRKFYYGVQLPAAGGTYRQFRTEGPGVVGGSSVFFGASLQPYTMTAGQKYTFLFYADSNGATVEDLVFVGNAGAAGITAYPVTATGDTPPVRKIAGPKTGITNLRSIAADADGDLVVANAPSATSASSSVETFAEGANGNSSPAAVFSVPGFVSQIAVDPNNANIYVALGPRSVNWADRVSTYSPTGVLLRTIFLQNTSPTSAADSYKVTGLTVDDHDALIIAGDNANFPFNQPGYFVCAIQVFAATATASTPPEYVIGLSAPRHVIACGPAAYLRPVDHILAVDEFSDLLELQNNSTGAVVRTGLGIAYLPAFDAVATNLAGTEIFVGSSYAKSVIRLAPSGTTFTIEPYLIGAATGLAAPVGLAVAAP